jgi:peptide/nickel transport system substrate-binding protein
MKMLIDRKKMLDIVVHGRGLVSADTLIAPTDPFYPSDLQPFPFDPEQAKSLLASAGYATGFKDNIWTTTAYPYLDEGAAYGKQAWAAANLDMTIQSTDNDTYIAAFLVKPIVMDYGLRLHPVTMLEQYAASASGSNLSRLKDAQVDTLLTQVKSTADVSKQKQIMGELIHRYNDVSAEINPFHFSNLWPIKKRAKGIIIDPMTVIDFREATLG